jgi:hypothetical protein
LLLVEGVAGLVVVVVEREVLELDLHLLLLPELLIPLL